MSILIVSQYFWPERFRINDLARELKRRGHEVTVLTGMPNYPAGKVLEGYRWPVRRREDYEGVSVWRVPLFARRQGRGWQLALNYLSFMVSACVLGPWYFRKHSFDVIFVFEPSPFTVGVPAALMRRLKRAPMLFWVQDLWPESLDAAGGVRSRMILGMVGRMVRWIYRRCDRVLLQSRAFETLAVKAGAPPDRIRYFPNWAESFYRPIPRDQARWPAGVLPEGFRIVFAGNLGEAQALETLLDAAERTREGNIRWIMIGDGRRAGWMRDEVRRRGLDGIVLFLGAYPAEAMPHFFAHADALLMTLKRDETFARTVPSKLQSYMACARPVLAALDGEGARVVGESGCGLVVPAEDGAALAEAALKLAAMDTEAREAMGCRGRERYEAEFERNMLIAKLDRWMAEAAREGLCAS